MSEGFTKSIIHYNKNKFDKECILEDLDFDIINYDDYYDVVFENNNYKICKPKQQEGMIPLSSGTRWLHQHDWGEDSRRKQGYDDLDFDSWFGRNWNRLYIILDKNNQKKKWVFYDGYGDIYAPSGARYPCATWVAENGDEQMWRWFLDQKFPYISTNLDKKVGHKMMADKEVFIYPDDMEKLTWHNKHGSNITKIEFSPGVTRIKAGAFSGLQKVKEVVIPEGVKIIGNRAFYNTLIEKVTLPSTITTIGERAFGYCRALKEINLPEGLVKLGYGTFETDTALEKMPTWPKSLNYIPDYCFSSCHSLKSINIANHVVKLGNGAFDGVEVESVIIPNSVESIGKNVFEGKYLKYAYIPASVKEIGDYAFGSIFHYSWSNSPRFEPELVIDCEVSEKPSGWSKNWDEYNRERKDEYQYNYDRNDDEIWNHYSYKINWGVKSPRVSVTEDLELDDSTQIPGLFTEEQKDKFLDLLISLPELAESNREEFLRICDEWLLNIWMSDNTPSKSKIDSYIETLSNPDIYHIPVLWAVTNKNGGANYLINRYNDDDDGLYNLLDDSDPHSRKFGTLSPHLNICVSTNFLKDFLGINTDDLFKFFNLCLDEDLEFDTEGMEIKPEYQDEHWAIYHPKSPEDFMVLADGTTWYESNNNDNYTDWRLNGYYQSIPYYVFENKDTGDKYLYNTRDNWSSVETANGRRYDSNSNRNYLGYSRTAGNHLGRFLLDMPNSTGIAKWCMRKWPQGLAELKAIIKGKELLDETNGVVIYKSELWNNINSVSWWDKNRKLYDTIKKTATGIGFPRNTHIIEHSAFRDYESVQQIIIPSTVTEIQGGAFSGCKSVNKIILSNRIKTIGSYVFSGCREVKSIVIPRSCTTMGERPFSYCDFDTIYCEAESKPEGWDESWDIKTDSRETWNGPITHHRFNVVWGSTGPVQEDLDIDASVVDEVEIPEDKRKAVADWVGYLPDEDQLKGRWSLSLIPDDYYGQLGSVRRPYFLKCGGGAGFYLSVDSANKLLDFIGSNYVVYKEEE